MPASSPPRLEPGSVVLSRYRVEELLEGPFERPAYAGVVSDTAEPVQLFVLSAEEVSALEALPRVRHGHLAKVLEVGSLDEKHALLVTERVDGPTLEQRLWSQGPLTPVDAVRVLLRVADAVSALHQAGVVHGHLHPACVACRPGSRASPQLGFLPSSPAAADYRSPERGGVGRPSTADDTWALGGLLFEMLTAQPPPAGGIRSSQQLLDANVGDSTLRDVLARVLAAHVARRLTGVSELKRELARWFVEHAADEADPSRPPSTPPPPLPESSRPTAGTNARAASGHPPVLSRRSRRWLGVAAAAVPFGVAVAWAVSTVQSGEPVELAEVPTPPRASGAPASASTPSIDLSAVRVRGEHELATGDRMATCVAGYLPKGAFVRGTPDLDWVCEQQDPRTGARQLRAALLSGSGGEFTKVVQLVSAAGWYQMAIYAVVRAGCCADPKPLALPEPSESCPRMDRILSRLGGDVVVAHDHQPALRQYAEAAECEVRAGRARAYGQMGAPGVEHRMVFDQFAKLLRSP